MLPFRAKIGYPVKRAIRALLSDDYKKAQAKHSLLPKIQEQADALQAFSLLPRSLLALRVTKIETEGGKPAKRVKGLWTGKHFYWGGGGEGGRGDFSFFAVAFQAALYPYPRFLAPCIVLILIYWLLF